MLKIGITGGIGSGKSLVCKILESIGYPVFYSDDISKSITINNQEVRSALILRYGDNIYQGQQLNRSLLSQKIFENPNERLFVNELIHPKVREAFDQFASSSSKPFVFNEAAILFETGSYKHFDRTILVTAPEDTRIERVMKRDHCNKEAVVKRIDSQWKDERKIKLADGVIVNDGKHQLLIQIEKLLIDLVNQD